MVAAFLNAKYTNEERHARRLAKVQAIEARYASGAVPTSAR
jgi:ribose 5-phosphate isomerase B